MVVIAILGILIAIAIIIWLGILEQRRVDAAINQLAGDMRLAHSNATNQLTDWRVVLYPDRGDQSAGPDYYLVKLTRPYNEDTNSGTPPVADPATAPQPRTLPDSVKVMNQTNVNGAPIVDNSGSNYYLNPTGSGSIRTVEFNSDGRMLGYGSPSGTIRVTIDGNPTRSLTYQAATSRVEVAP
jgi:Tfp pilus assembly protein FimT